MADLRDRLRALPVLRGTAPPFDPDAAPAEPVALFAAWLDAAIAAGVAEPHAMTLSTVDAGGRPDARVLICKDVDGSGWHFGFSGVSRKGRELASRPDAALTFYWRELGRQVRVRGRVVRDPEAVRTRDFRARGADARALALVGRQSSPVAGPDEIEAELATARQRIDAEPDTVPDNWVSYAVVADEVEFFQASPTRLHQRLRYERAGDAWTLSQLWP